MSDGHDQDTHEGATDAHDDHGFDGEPAKELGPGEPMTPGWVPALGGALFVGLALFGLLSSEKDGATTAAPTSSTTGAEVAPKPPQALPSTLRPAPRPDLAPAKSAPGTPPTEGSMPAIKRLSPQERMEVERRLKEKMQPQPGAK